MTSRALIISLTLSLVAATAAADERPYELDARHFRVRLDRDAPRLADFAINSRGGGTPDGLLLPKTAPPAGTRPAATWRSKVSEDGRTVNYQPMNAPASAPAAWSFTIDEGTLTIRSRFVEGAAAATAEPFVMRFDPKVAHVTLLGRMPAERAVALPCTLHAPGHGTLRISADVKGATLAYDARRFVPEPFVEVGFPAATKEQTSITYKLEIARVYPPRDGDHGDQELARNFLNIFQLNPRLRVLANNAASDPVAFTVYKYADVAATPNLPPIAEGLTALDLVRATLDRYLAGMKGYGLVGYRRNMDGADTLDWASKFDALDALPSLLSASCTYATAAKDDAWARANWRELRAWAVRMLASDKDGNGLLEYGLSGNSGSRSGKGDARPSNWWDQIGFGHEDAYANALAYRALTQLAALADRLNEKDDAARFAEAARKLKAAYRPAFYSDKTGLLAGWRSADGQLHDYAFTFVTSCAVCWDLLERDDAAKMMITLLARMKASGFTDFSLGLPGNLIPIRRADYVTLKKRWGGPEKEDGSDTFGVFENGGATHCFVYFTVAALRKVGLKDEADAIAKPMLAAIYDGQFQGRATNGMTREWKDWKGNAWGYEGFLVDGYLMLRAAVD